MRCVTSFSEDGYELYGRQFLETYVEHHDVPIWVYYENKKPDFEHELVTYKDLFKVEGLNDYLYITQMIPACQGHVWGEEKYNYRFDTFKFCRKSFAQIDAAATNTDWLYWVDADIVFDGPITFPQPKDAFMVYLGRPEWHSCTSFIGFNMKHEMAGEFMRRYWMIHVTGTIFCLPEWADPQVLDWLRVQTKVPAINLAEGIGGLNGPANVFDHVFQHGNHRKGNLKHKDHFLKKFGNDTPYFRNRYEELLSLVETLRPKRILEIGVWNGQRAIEMCRLGAEYVGFDLFEDANDLTDEEEKNIKPHHTVEEVSKVLSNAGVRHQLIKGNTRETLAEYDPEEGFDFAFIDGGHSVETIESDWSYVRKLMKPGGVVVFDDYYEGDIDTEKFGANKIVDDLDCELLNARDRVYPHGYTRLALVRL